MRTYTFESEGYGMCEYITMTDSDGRQMTFRRTTSGWKTGSQYEVRRFRAALRRHLAKRS